MAQNKTSGGTTTLAYVGGAAVAIVIVVGGIYLAGPGPVSEGVSQDEPANEAAAIAPTPDPVVEDTPAPTPAVPAQSEQAADAPAPEPTPEPEPDVAADPVEQADPAPAPEEPQVAETTPTTEPEVIAEPAEDIAEEPGLPPLSPPSFDLVRVDPTGEALVAGKSVPDAEVDVLVDNVVLSTARAAQADGAFVSFLTIPQTGQVQVLTLRARLGDQSVLSEDQIILAPLVAEVEPDPEPEVVETVSDPLVTPEEQSEVTTLMPERDEALSGQSADETGAEARAATIELPDQLSEADSAPQTPTEPAASSVDDVTSSPSQADPATAAPVIALAEPAPEVPVVEEAPKEEPAPLVVAEAPEPEPAPASQPEPEAEPTPVAEPARETTETAAADVVAQVAEPEPEPAPTQEPAPTAVPEPEPEPEPEPQAPSTTGLAVLKAGPDGLEVLTPADPADTRTELALDAIGYSAEGDVQLAGRAGAGLRVRIYMDNRLTDQVVADDSNRWSANLDGIAPGIYRLRLDELDAEGSVLNRVETPFKREAPEVLQPLVASEDGEAAQPPVRAVTVQEGDTLWAISRDRYGDGFLYVKVFEANRTDIRDPDLIYPGQVFALPD